MYYFNIVKATDDREKISLQKVIRKIQKYRNTCRVLEANWSQEDSGKIAEWRKNKSFELIYKMIHSYRSILNRHKLGIINQIVVNVKNELETLKEKYFTQ